MPYKVHHQTYCCFHPPPLHAGRLVRSMPRAAGGLPSSTGNMAIDYVLAQAAKRLRGELKHARRDYTKAVAPQPCPLPAGQTVEGWRGGGPSELPPASVHSVRAHRPTTPWCESRYHSFGGSSGVGGETSPQRASPSTSPPLVRAGRPSSTWHTPWGPSSLTAGCRASLRTSSLEFTGLPF